MTEGLRHAPACLKQPTDHTLVALRPPWGLGFLVPDLSSGPSEGHSNMRDDQSQVGPLGSRRLTFCCSHMQSMLLVFTRGSGSGAGCLDRRPVHLCTWCECVALRRSSKFGCI